MSTSARPLAQAATGRRGMVVTGHHDATQAAWKVLSAGGTVTDAAVAGAAVLAVTQPQACTIGGDLFALVHDAKSGTTRGLNASGAAPALTRFEGAIPQRGPTTINVPGMVGGWEALHRSGGRLPWKDLLQPAIALARDGCEASRIFAKSTEVYADLIRATEPSKALFHPEGRPIRQGERFFQPRLAQTLEAIARDGAAALYDGPIGRRLGQACESQGAFLREADLRGYRPEWVEPIEVAYRGHRVRAMPPNSYGLYLLLQLLGLEEQDLKAEALDSPRRIAALVRAARAAFQVGSRAVADPAFAEPFAPLLGEAGRKRLRAARGAEAPNLGGTAILSAVDAEGNAVTLVQSIFLVFGSGIVDPETGVLFSNRLIGFTAEAGHPNRWAPGKRPAHTLCPCQVFDGSGALRYSLGTPGGPGQTLTIAQVVQAMLDRGATLQEAISTPRWSQDLGSAALVEDEMPQATVEGVRALGLALDKAPPHSPFFGSAEGVERRDGVLTGVADFRRDATAYGE